MHRLLLSGFIRQNIMHLPDRLSVEGCKGWPLSTLGYFNQKCENQDTGRCERQALVKTCKLYGILLESGPEGAEREFEVLEVLCKLLPGQLRVGSCSIRH